MGESFKRHIRRKNNGQQFQNTYKNIRREFENTYKNNGREFQNTYKKKEQWARVLKQI